MKIQASFVQYIPRDLAFGTLYISREYSTASHLCCCGCGKEVVTPLTPTDWSVSVKEGLVSVSPSIGNWNFPCRSHYWIWNSKIIWAEDWSEERVNAARRLDTVRKERYFDRKEVKHGAKGSDDPGSRQEWAARTASSVTHRIWRWIVGNR